MGGDPWVHPARARGWNGQATTDLAVKQTKTQGACLAVALSSGCDPGQGYKGASVGAGHRAHLAQGRRLRSEEGGPRGETRLEVPQSRGLGVL